MRHWTPEERERQSRLIRKWKPWEKSTGPKTIEGKVTVSGNAMKHGMRSSQWQMMKALMADNGWLLKEMGFD